MDQQLPFNSGMNRFVAIESYKITQYQQDVHRTTAPSAGRNSENVNQISGGDEISDHGHLISIEICNMVLCIILPYFRQILKSLQS